MRIVFTGGGTGGHIYPLIAVARELNRIYQGTETLEMFFLGENSFSKDDFKREGIRAKTILAGKLRRYFSLKIFWDLLKMPLGLLQALWHLYVLMPDVIFSKGGYASVPVIIIGWLYRIPILAHESDIVPGISNRLAAKFAKRIALSFEKTAKHFPVKKTALVGNPIRQEIIQICSSNNPADKENARKILGITSQRPVIFVSGSSQGAEKINQALLRILAPLLEKYEVIHQCGPKNLEKVVIDLKTVLELNQQSSLPENYHLFPFLEETQMAAAYYSADLVIGRASAGTIFETAACAKPSILIPLPNAAADHQKENAFAYAQTGATVVLDQINLTPHLFLSEINKILDNRETVEKMSLGARNFFRPEAASKIAQALIEIGER